MAEAASLSVAKSVVEQLSSPALKEVLLNKELNRIRETIQTITDFLRDAEQRESEEHLVMKGWLSRLRSIVYEVDKLFDVVAARALPKKAMTGNAFKREVKQEYHAKWVNQRYQKGLGRKQRAHFDSCLRGHLQHQKMKMKIKRDQEKK